MSRLEEGYEELIQREIDGELSAQEKITVRDYVSKNAGARELKDGLAGVAQALNQMEAVEPPEDLRKSILAALPKRHSATGVFRPRSFLAKLPVLKYGYALAAGLVLGFVLHPFLFNPNSTLPGAEVRGSMIPRSQLTLSAGGISGSVEVRASESGSSLEFDLETQKAVQVEVGFDAAAVEFKGFSQQISKVASFTVTRGRIIVQCEGKQRFIMRLSNPRGLDSNLNIGIYVSGKLVRSGSVRLPKLG